MGLLVLGCGTDTTGDNGGLDAGGDVTGDSVQSIDGVAELPGDFEVLADLPGELPGDGGAAETGGDDMVEDWGLAEDVNEETLADTEGELAADVGEDTGEPDPQTNPEAFVFVDGTGGQDGNPGTPQAPKKTLNDALALAVSSGRDLVVAEGTYTESLTFTGDRRVLGGYEASGWTRDPKAHKTTVLRPVANGFVVKVSGAEVRLDGLEISNGVVDADASGTQDFTALQVQNGGSVVLYQATVLAGKSTNNTKWHYHIAVSVEQGCQAQITESYVDGGGAALGTTKGIAVGRMGYEGAPSSLKLYRSIVLGGECNIETSAVVVAYKCTAELVGSFIDGGRTAGGDVWTINAMAPSTIFAINNTIFGGRSNTGRAAAFNSSSQSGSEIGDFTLVNNILEGGKAPSSWVVVSHSVSKVTLVQNNLHGNGTGENCLVGRWVGYGLNCLAEKEKINDCTQWVGAAACLKSEGNSVVDPGVAGFELGDWHLLTGSPMIDAGLAPQDFYGGDAHKLDLDGQVRPDGAAIDLGADEYVPTK